VEIVLELDKQHEVNELIVVDQMVEEVHSNELMLVGQMVEVHSL
jgi:hypothetical protein